MQTLENPYAKMPPERLVRVAIWMGDTDHGYLKSLHPRTSLWQNAIALFLQSIVNELRQRNITGWSLESQSLVQSLVRQRCTPAGTPTNTTVPDDPGAADGVHSTGKGHDVKPANTKRSPTGGKRKTQKGDGSGAGKGISI